MNFKVMPNWKRIAFLTVLYLLAIDGLISIPGQVTAKFESYVRSYAQDHGMVAEKVKEVAVVRQEDIKGQVNEAIKENLTPAPTSNGK